MPKSIAVYIAGWSSSVARRAHNPKVVGSNPAPATKQKSPCLAINMGIDFYVYAALGGAVHLLYTYGISFLFSLVYGSDGESEKLA